MRPLYKSKIVQGLFLGAVLLAMQTAKADSGAAPEPHLTTEKDEICESLELSPSLAAFDVAGELLGMTPSKVAHTCGLTHAYSNMIRQYETLNIRINY